MPRRFEMGLRMSENCTILVVYNGCIYLEVAHAVSRLASRSRLIIATPDGASVRVGEGWTIAADSSFVDAPFAQAKSVLVPGGDIFEVKDSATLDRFLAESHAAGATIGGICNGALLVAKSGLLRGKPITHVATETYAPGAEFRELREYAQPHVQDSIFLDEDVVIASNKRIVTAKPWAAISFAVAVGKLCGAFDDERDAERWESYQRGQRLVTGR